MKNPSFKQGLIWGISVGIAQFIVDFINTSTNIGAFSLLLTVLVFLFGIAAYLIAGWLAAKQTGKVSTGTIAGLWTGVFYGIIGAIGTIVTISTNLSARLAQVQDFANQMQLQIHYTPGLLLAGGIIDALVGAAFAIGIGSGIGALGGLIGRSQAPKQPYPAYPYPPMYQGMPPYQQPPQGMPPYQQPPQGKLSYQPTQDTSDPYQSYPYAQQPYQPPQQPQEPLPYPMSMPPKQEGDK